MAVFPEAVKRMHLWKQAGGRIIGVSNQGGIALGLVSMASVGAAMLETQRQCDDLFDRIAFCQHHPDAEHPEMARCWCRKPRPGLAIETAISLADAHPGGDTVTTPTPTEILDLPLDDANNNSDAHTIRGYLTELLLTLWREGEGFSGKRPFGNSSWEHDLYVPLMKAGYIDGALDEDGYVERVDTDSGDRLIADAIVHLGATP